jgi:hypothetical protein
MSKKTDALIQTYIDRAILADKRTSEAEKSRDNWKADYEAAKIRSNEWQRKFAKAEKERDEARKALEEKQ